MKAGLTESGESVAGCEACEFREKCEDAGNDLDCGNKYECGHYEEWLDADEVMWDYE